MYHPISSDLFSRFQQIVGAENILSERTDIEPYARDETEDLRFYPEVVAKPATSEELAALLKLCNEFSIPATPRGGGTGLSGGALAVFGGLLISMERFDRIIEIDERNLQATVETGVITQVFMNAVAEKNLLYPIDPASKASSFMGGNLAHGCGGPRVVKYGNIRDYVLNLEVVLPTGEIIWTGANTLKYASGYNLTQLMIGAEGTLGIVTKIVVKLLPRPSYDVLMFASFASNEQACSAVSAIFHSGQVPSALEFMERRGVEWVIRYDKIDFDLKENAQAFLLIEADGNNLAVLLGEAEKIQEVLRANGCLDVRIASDEAEKQAMWRIRKVMPVSVKSNSIYKEEDTVVPRAELPQLIRGIKEIGHKYGFQSVCYGHAGDGNLHVNVIKGEMTDDDWNNRIKAGIREVFELTVSLGGTISGEHGIGLVQKEYMNVKYSDVHMNLMKGIKKVFDPNNILNPGKIFQ